MDRRPPRTTSDEIDLYINTYYSLLRSSGEVRVRAFEEAHLFSNSSLHEGARDPAPDIAAFRYSAGRLPGCAPQVKRIILGQSESQYQQAGFDIGAWETVKARGRRRAMRFNGIDTLAVFVTSTSDIDDLIPILTAYQIEWNKMHRAGKGLGLSKEDKESVVTSISLPWERVSAQILGKECDFSVRLLSGSFNEYQRSAQRWWSEIAPHYLTASSSKEAPSKKRRPVYFVSSNTHSLANLIGGYTRLHRDEIIDFGKRRNPEGLAKEIETAQKEKDEARLNNILYFLLREFLHEENLDARQAQVQKSDKESGLVTVESPGRIDVSAQVIELCKLKPDRVDPRIAVSGIEALQKSDAVIINIDYPLGMAAYHHLTRLGQGVGELRGIYVMGKAATLNSRIGDVMISDAIYDEHSQNTYLLRNCFAAADVQAYMQFGTVLDNQKAVTVRSAFLQNRDYMSLFYNQGYTVMEMETGPYLSAAYELQSPRRHPADEIVNLSATQPCDLGFLHYASDTPYSRRQNLLSKSLSFFGVESTYACSIAILRRIFELELNQT